VQRQFRIALGFEKMAAPQQILSQALLIVKLSSRKTHTVRSRFHTG